MSTNSFNDFSTSRAAEIKQSAERGFTGGTAMGADYKAQFEAQRAATAPGAGGSSWSSSSSFGTTPGGGYAPGGRAGRGASGSLGLLAGNLVIYVGIIGALVLTVFNRTQSLWTAVILFVILAAAVGTLTRGKAAQWAISLLGWATLALVALHILVQSGVAGQRLIDIYVPVTVWVTKAVAWYLVSIGFV